MHGEVLAFDWDGFYSTALPSWIAAVGSVGAALVAIFALQKAAAAIGTQNKQLVADQDERRHAQARLVYALRREERRNTEYHGSRDYTYSALIGIAVEIHNTSAQPIFDMRVVWNIPISGATTWGKAVLEPGDEVSWSVKSYELDRGSLLDAKYLVFFRDNGGHWWRIDPDGRRTERTRIEAEGDEVAFADSHRDNIEVTPDDEV